MATEGEAGKRQIAGAFDIALTFPENCCTAVVGAALANPCVEVALNTGLDGCASISPSIMDLRLRRGIAAT